MAAFQRSAAAIARNQERTAALMRNARPRPASNINNNILNSSEEGPDPSTPIVEPQSLGTLPNISAMTPRCALEPPASAFTTAGANSMLQSYATPSSVAQPTQGQRLAAHNFTSIPAQSQHWQANSAAFQSHNQPFNNSPANLVSPSRPMSSIQQLTTAVQPLQPTLQQPQPTLHHRFLPSPSTGRSVAHPLWEVLAPSSLMRWHLRPQCRCADNLRWCT